MLKHLSAFIFLLLMINMATFAQSGKKPVPATKTSSANKTTPASNKRPAKLRSSWGLFLSDTLPKSQVVKLLDSALVVRDEKNHVYPVISFAFTYEQHQPYLNDTTGQPGIYKDYTGDNFKTSRLPALWSTRLKESLQQGDVLYFDDILIEYAPDKIYRAPSLRIDVK
ncbi:hypothetical protein SAMN04488128_1011260 [Chitinophaga eiseniae]|uniref:Gliding motility-associated lipoprotein GldH n=1 Tax=Chitinophaga eiseniae TaxID=634771 RepID=A0A1T4MT65_9BACT|nr:hypothetical protein [Chitinophaga eiseniae]SJZ70036.1 hypothetical protein SAMN04488128_1011260 [Chitinophaga eiseniae]